MTEVLNMDDPAATEKGQTTDDGCDEDAIDGVLFIEPFQLYNLLNQTTLDNPCVANVNYLLLFDARRSAEYGESHVITAKHVHKNGEEFNIPTDAEIETKKHIVVYDNRTQGFDTKRTSLGLQCAEFLWKTGSKNPVQVVRGGYEDFSARYPFLRTQKRMWTPKELCAVKTYPIEVVPGYLFMGTFEHAQDQSVHKHLKIKAHVNVSKNQDTRFNDSNKIMDKDQQSTPAIFNIPVADDYEDKKMGESYFQSSAAYIGAQRKLDGRSLLVYSDLGTSRAAAIVLAYLMQAEKISLKDAWLKLKCCENSICPNTSFVEQLSEWEQKIHGQKITDISTIYAWNH